MKRQNVSTEFDAVIIGSGIGSLTTAAILADYGMRVIVLERHEQLGGYTQGFQRQTWYWDVAVHYLSCMEPGDLFFHGCRYLTENQIRWKKMPDIFDHYCFPDFQVDVPSTPGEYQRHLKSLFPDECHAVDRYFNDLLSFRTRLTLLWLPKILPIPILRLLNPFLRLALRKLPDQTTGQYLDRIGCSEQLKAAVCAPWGTFGGLPGESSIYEHWLTPGSYIYGAWYPAGGVSSIPKSLGRFIENKGGSIRTSAGVKEIIVDESGNKATGVRLDSGELINGRSVISGVGIRSTFTNLVNEQSVPPELVEVLRAYDSSVSYVQLYAGLNADPSTISGLDGSNYWIASTTKFPTGIKDLKRDQNNRLTVDSVMLTFPSLKDPDASSHTLTICAWINYEFFQKWAGTKSHHRPAEYEVMKTRLEKALLEPVLNRFPQLQDMIEYATVGTPLTVEHYMGHAKGSAYGLSSPPGRYNDYRLRPETAIDNLFLTGSDIASSGVPGAFAGGVFCASVILKKNVAADLIRRDKVRYGDAPVREDLAPAL